MIVDIHTHQLFNEGLEVIYNLTPQQFKIREYSYYSLGIHPWEAAEADKKRMLKFKEQALHPAVVLIGEIGLDKRCEIDFNTQHAICEQQMRYAEEIQKPVILHCVKAHNELIQLKRAINPQKKWIIHGFRGNKNLASTLIDEDFYLSYGEYYQNQGLKNTPLDHLFVETDNSTLSIDQIYENVARDFGLTTHELKKAIGINIRMLFR